MSNETPPVTINGEDILLPANAVSNFKELPPIQRAGMNLAAGVGLLAAIIIIGIGIAWMTNIPGTPQLPTDATNLKPEYFTNSKQLLENYKTASELALDGPTKLFDQLIVKIFYPLFTLILGYIFGTNRGVNADGGSS